MAMGSIVHKVRYAADFSIAETCVFPWCKKFTVVARLRDMLAGRQFQAFGAERQQTELLRCFRDVLQSELASIGRLVLVDRRAIHRRSASAADRDLRSVQHKCRYWREAEVREGLLLDPISGYWPRTEP